MTSRPSADQIRKQAALRQAARQLRETTPPPKRGWWTYPAGWLRTEKFWMEVTTRTIAGVLSVGIVAVLSYIYAILAGYVAGPDWLNQITNILAFSLYIPIIGVIVLSILIVISPDQPKVNKRFARYTFLLMILLAAGVTLELIGNAQLEGHW